jgi:hypothetical protein
LLAARPPAARPPAGNPSPDAFHFKNPIKPTLARHAVATAVLHKHPPIIRVGADLIHFVYGSRWHLANGVCPSQKCSFLPGQVKDLLEHNRSDGMSVVTVALVVTRLEDLECEFCPTQSGRYVQVFVRTRVWKHKCGPAMHWKALLRVSNIKPEVEARVSGLITSFLRILHQISPTYML